VRVHERRERGETLAGATTTTAAGERNAEKGESKLSRF